MTPKRNWIEVDMEGFAALIEEPARLSLELWQNCADENVTLVNIDLESVEGRRGIAYLRVEDDCPEGFADLTESYKLYAPSKKRDDATKRGRMNVGEKRVLALCESAYITSTTGRVSFNADGTRTASKVKRDAGTLFEAMIRYTQVNVAEALSLLRSVLVPEGVTLTVNGEVVAPRPALREVTATLATVLPDADGNLNRKTRRKTTVRLVEPVGVEVPTIFELGIPVVEHDGKFHIDVAQRVPLSETRDNVPPAYLRELRETILNATFDLLQPEDAHSTWVADALPNASPEALQGFVKARYGDKVVVRDNSDSGREATLRAIEQGYAVIEGRHLPKGMVTILRDSGIVQAAGEIKSLTRTVTYTPGGKDISVKVEDYTPGMHRVVDYAKKLGQALLGYTPSVVVERYPMTEGNHLANYGGGTLRLNLTRLSHRFFNDCDQIEVDDLLLHEFAHDKATNHFSDDFYNACTKLGAKLRHTDLWL